MARLKSPEKGPKSRTSLEEKLGPKRGKIRLVLTGSVASGKSTALKAFEQLGWKTLSADSLVSEIYEREGVSKEELRLLAQDNPKKLKQLQKWVWPKVKAEIEKWMKREKGRLIVEVPLVFEARLQDLFDASLYIFAPKAERKKRAKARGMKPKLFDFLESQQLPAVEKARKADITLHNRNKASLLRQIKIFHIGVR